MHRIGQKRKSSSRRSYEESSRNRRIKKKKCCTEGDRAKQLRIDELSIPEKESRSTVHELMVQIQELQDKVNSLNDFSEFNDPETASSSGSSHVPSQLMRIPSPRGSLSRDSCLEPDTRNSFGISGNVLDDPPAPSEPPAAFFDISRNSASAQCEPVSLITGRLLDRGNELERNTRNFAIPTPRFARKISTWNPPSRAQASPQNCMVEQLRNQVSEMHFDKFLHLSTCP